MLSRVLLAASLAYALLCGGAALRHRELLYPAPGEDQAILPLNARQISLVAGDGVPVIALEIPPPPGGRVVVYFHGNGETIGSRLDVAEQVARRGFGALLIEYRGYGRSVAAGKPTEEGLYADATAGLDHLLKQGIGPDRVALWGFSLGTGVAAEMAQRGRGSRLILEAPFTSIPDLGARLYHGGAMRWAVFDRYDTLGKAKSIRIPTLIVAGTEDEVIPLEMPKRLSNAISGAQLVVVDGGHHADLLAREGEGLWRTLVEFIERGAPPILRHPSAAKGRRS